MNCDQHEVSKLNRNLLETHYSMGIVAQEFNYSSQKEGI